YAFSVAIQSDGKVIVSGYSGTGIDNDFSMVRYNTDGSLDTSFDGDGRVTTDFGNGDDQSYGIAIQSDGKILLVGQSYNGADNDLAIARYNTDGSLDTSFDLVNTLDGTPGFLEDGAAVVLDADVTISDDELDALNGGNGNYDGASLTLVRNGGANAEDVFSATGTLAALTDSGNLVVGATTIGTVTTNSAGTLLLTFNTNATTALVNSALQQIAYSNSSDTPPASAQIDWTFDDGNTGSQGSGGALDVVGSTTVTIAAANDDPTNAGSLPTDIAVTQDASSNVDLSAIDLSDVDAASSSLTVTLTTSTGGNLTATNGGGVTVGGSGTGVLTLDGTLADLNTFLNTASNISYLHGTPGTNGNDADTIEVKVNDNGNTGIGDGTDIDLGTVNVDIAATNNLPTAANSTVATNEDTTYPFTAADFGYSDVDADTMASVKITTLETVGALRLSGADVTLNQVITKADIDAGNLKFVPVADANGTSYDSFAFSVNDGTADSASTYAMTVDVNAANDQPVFHQPELVINGTFDSDISNWATTGTVQGSGDNGGSLRFGYSNGVGPHTAQQTIATIAGATYELTFDYKDNSSSRSQSLQVTADGTGNLLDTGHIVTDIAGNTYVRYSYSFTADSTSTTLVFTDTSDTSGLTTHGTVSVDGFLDNISVQYTSGPLSEASFTEDGAAVVLDADVGIRDVELDALNGGLGNYDGASLTLVRNGGASAEDVFSNSGLLSALTESGALIYNGTTIGTVTTNSGGTLLLTFNTNATSALVDSTLQSIAYSNSSDVPPASAQIDWTFDDGNTGGLQGTGGALQATGSTTVTITAVEDIPTITNLGGDALAYSEGDGAVVIEQGADTIVADVDSTDFDTGTLTVSFTAGSDSAEDILGIRNQGYGTGEISVAGFGIAYEGTLIGSFTGGTGGNDLVITLNANANAAAVQALIENITYENTDSDSLTAGARTVRFVLSDGDGGTSANYDTTVNVSAINSSPTFDTGDGIVTTAIGSAFDFGYSTVVQPDGKILVAGNSWNGTDTDFALTRYNADGSLDTTFDTDGILITDFGSGEDSGQSVVVQSDGKILVAGNSYNGTDTDFALTRYNTDGSLDTS
ncbi:MAG: DUF642 domain-containing protein, partial [Gammaproteobacteria bacterium]|nr:DUF642 domain-containing protein [Gammaproteobacteria bacterium]